MAGLVQHSSPVSVGQSLSLEHVFGHAEASLQKPSQQSWLCAVSHSLDCVHGLGHTSGARHRPETPGARCGSLGPLRSPAIDVQHAWPMAVSQSLDCWHCFGQSAAAVHTGWARSVQHLGAVRPQSLSLEQLLGQAPLGAHTLLVEAGLAWQQASPWSVWQSESWLQKRGQLCGCTQAFAPEPKSQHSSPCPAQSESALHDFGQLDLQSGLKLAVFPLLLLELVLLLQATTAASAVARKAETPHARSKVIDVLPGRPATPVSRSLPPRRSRFFTGRTRGIGARRRRTATGATGTPW
jgi:hypothetical protein